MPNPEIIGPATLSITQGISAFMTFLPSLSEVRKADPVKDSAVVGDVRLGEVAATAVCIGVGVITSSLTGSPVPAFVSAVVALTLICIYEGTLNANNPFDPTRTTVRATHA